MEEYFPKADHGSILITSQLASVWPLGTFEMKLEPVNDLQGEAILKNSLGKSVEGEHISIPRSLRHCLISEIQQARHSLSACFKVLH